MTDYLEPLGEEKRLEMALQDPRGLSDAELTKRAFESLGGDNRRDQIIQTARWEIERRQAKRFQRESADAAKRSHMQIMFATWVLVVLAVLQFVLSPAQFPQDTTTRLIAFAIVVFAYLILQMLRARV